MRLFAVLRERAGRGELELELPDGAHVADALAQVQHLAPGTTLVLAVNGEYAEPADVLRAGDELAVVPPVSGGAVVDTPLSVDAVAARVRDPRAGAVVTFSGVTREVAFLDYEAYAEMAAARIERIVAEAVERHGLCAAAADHRTGRVGLGEPSVVVAASAPHRGEAFAGAREIIDRIKAEAPIWKKEEGDWVAGTVPPVGAAPAREAVVPGAVLDVAVDARLEHGSRLLVVRGADEAEARVGWLGGRFHQLRLDEPLTVARGDRVELRRLGDDELLGDATVLDPAALRHGPSNDVLVRLMRLERGEAVEAPGVSPERERDRPIAPPPLDADALALERRYVQAGADPPADAELDEVERAALFALREAGRVVRLEPGRHVHRDVA